MSQFRLKMILLFSLLTVCNLAQAQYTGPYHSIDIRDHIQFGSYNDLPTHTLMTALVNRPCEFLAPKQAQSSKPNLNFCDFDSKLTTNPNMKFTPEGAMGPEGYVSGETFIPTNRQEWTRQDVIFSVEFDGENSVIKVDEGLYLAKIILFIHDSQRSPIKSEQYYFRRLTVKTDASKIPIDNPERVEIVSIDQDIPISETYFEVFTDVAQRKMVLLDQLHNIKKVFPVGVGAFDIRTLPGMDNFVGSMTEELKTQAILAKEAPLNPEGQPYFVPMTEERNTPSWYKGRPFLGILDENGTKYKEIGFHYQIDDDQLQRGFVSHGCVRVRDKDLYQLSSLIFKSVQRSMPVKVVNSFTIYSELFDLAYLDHPYPKINSTFKRIIYADRNYVSAEARAQVNPSIISIARATDFTEVERYEWCRQNGKYSVLRYHGPWASVLGTDCLTRITSDNRPVYEVIDAMLGLSFQQPQIAAHQYSTVSNYSNPFANINTAEICAYNLGSAAQVYMQLTSQNLTYQTFKDICGCNKLEYELQRGNYRDGWATFDRICR